MATILTVAAVAASALAVNSVSAGTDPSSVIALDTFDRQVSNGLGSAPIGGQYALEGDSAAHFTVTNGSAYVNGLAVGRSRGAYLPTTSSADTRVEVAAGVPTMSSARATHFYVAAEARRQPTGRAYRAEVSFTRSGKPLLAVSRIGAHRSQTSLGVIRLNWVAGVGQPFHLQLQALGGQPVRLAARAWLDRTPTPDWSLVTADNSPEQVESAGSVGFWTYRSTGSRVTNYAIGTFQAWSYDGDNAPVSSPPSGPSPTNSMTTSEAPTSTSNAPSSSPVSSTSSAGQSTSADPSPTPSDPSTSSSTTDPNPPPSSGQPGARPLGSIDYSIPSGSIFVSPSGNDSAAGAEGSPLRTIGAAVSKASSGKTIVLRGGNYHETVTVSKANLTIEPYPGEVVWLDGSVPVSGWTRQGSRWVHSGWTTQFDHSASFSKGSNAGGFVNSAHPMAAWPDQVFIGGTKLQQMSSANSVGSGEFAVDYNAHTITVGSDPGDNTRASDLQLAMMITAPHVTVQGIGVRRYATSLWQMGTVRVYGTSDLVRDIFVEDNATQGITFLHAGNTADHVTSSDNGMVGIHANEADDLTVTNSLMSGNNSEHFNASPSAAGIKVTKLKGLVLSGNDIEDNDANGIWLDASVRQFTITNNVSRGNHKGVVAELSANGIIANNILSGREIGIWILDTGNVKIFNNSVSNTTSRAIALEQDERRQNRPQDGWMRDPRAPDPDPSNPWLTQNITIADNLLASIKGIQFMAIDKKTHIPANSMNLVVNGNLFAPAGGSTGSTMAGWGAGDNHTMTISQTADAFDSARGKGWTNAQGSNGGYSAQYELASTSAVQSHAVPLPSDVAGAIGQPAGTKAVGAFL
ncbi:right-handed parallel beta-helix repeat-containing protein [uncultured Jatrophihabitans sp.]|uniref:right-handed parallel beta-helix repeat-containing protein n=1 Tax=uncultured Jatrophihabitans sp. TaxID=1610747 RepID=UPI0035CB031E